MVPSVSFCLAVRSASLPIPTLPASRPGKDMQHLMTMGYRGETVTLSAWKRVYRFLSYTFLQSFFCPPSFPDMALAGNAYKHGQE